MLGRNDFINRTGVIPSVDDENVIDLLLEGITINGQSVIELFYCCKEYGDVAIDYGGGVFGITCRDVVEISNSDPEILREQLGLRNTKQNNAACADVIRLCVDEVKRGGYLF